MTTSTGKLIFSQGVILQCSMRTSLFLISPSILVASKTNSRIQKQAALRTTPSWWRKAQSFSVRGRGRSVTGMKMMSNVIWTTKNSISFSSFTTSTCLCLQCSEIPNRIKAFWKMWSRSISLLFSKIDFKQIVSHLDITLWWTMWHHPFCFKGISRISQLMVYSSLQTPRSIIRAICFNRGVSRQTWSRSIFCKTLHSSEMQLDKWQGKLLPLGSKAIKGTLNFRVKAASPSRHWEMKLSCICSQRRRLLGELSSCFSTSTITTTQTRQEYSSLCLSQSWIMAFCNSAQPCPQEILDFAVASRIRLQKLELNSITTQ